MKLHAGTHGSRFNGERGAFSTAAWFWLEEVACRERLLVMSIVVKGYIA